jgi:superoxide reductase
MIKRNEIYKCQECGNIVEVLNGGAGELICCSEPMIKVEPIIENINFTERHIPVLRKDEDGEYIIQVGEIEHPMEDAHHVMFIEAISKDNKYLKRVFLSPNEKPVLDLKCKCLNMNVRELCNVHGLFETEVTKGM